jgi:hypothetical protein
MVDDRLASGIAEAAAVVETLCFRGDLIELASVRE